MKIRQTFGFEPSQFFKASEISGRRNLKASSSNSTTSVSGDDLHPIFNQNNTAITVNGLNNHPVLEGFNDTLTMSGDGGTLNVTGNNNQVIVNGFHITTYDAGVNNSISAQGVSDPVVKVPAPPQPAAPPNASAPAPHLAPAPAPLAPAPAPHAGRRLMTTPQVTGSNILTATPDARLTDSVSLGAAVGVLGLFGVVACFVAKRFYSEKPVAQRA